MAIASNPQVTWSTSNHLDDTVGASNTYACRMDIKSTAFVGFNWGPYKDPFNSDATVTSRVLTTELYPDDGESTTGSFDNGWVVEIVVNQSTYYVDFADLTTTRYTAISDAYGDVWWNLIGGGTGQFAISCSTVSAGDTFTRYSLQETWVADENYNNTLNDTGYYNVIKTAYDGDTAESIHIQNTSWAPTGLTNTEVFEAVGSGSNSTSVGNGPDGSGNATIGENHPAILVEPAQTDGTPIANSYLDQRDIQRFRVGTCGVSSMGNIEFRPTLNFTPSGSRFNSTVFSRQLYISTNNDANHIVHQNGDLQCIFWFRMPNQRYCAVFHGRSDHTGTFVEYTFYHIFELKYDTSQSTTTNNTVTNIASGYITELDTLSLQPATLTQRGEPWGSDDWASAMWQTDPHNPIKLSTTPVYESGNGVWISEWFYFYHSRRFDTGNVLVFQCNPASDGSSVVIKTIEYPDKLFRGSKSTSITGPDFISNGFNVGTNFPETSYFSDPQPIQGTSTGTISEFQSNTWIDFVHDTADDSVYIIHQILIRDDSAPLVDGVPAGAHIIYAWRHSRLLLSPASGGQVTIPASGLASGTASDWQTIYRDDVYRDATNIWRVVTRDNNGHGWWYKPSSNGLTRETGPIVRRMAGYLFVRSNGSVASRTGGRQWQLQLDWNVEAPTGTFVEVPQEELTITGFAPDVVITFVPPVDVAVNVVISPTISVVAEVAGTLTLDAFWELQESKSFIDRNVNLIITPNINIITGIPDYVDTTVTIVDTVTVTITTDIIDVVNRAFDSTNIHFGTTFTTELIALVNADRAAASLPPVAEIIPSRYQANQAEFDVTDLHARDMRDNDEYLLDSTNFTSGYQTTVERAEQVNAQLAVFSNSLIPFTDGVGTNPSASNYPSANTYYNTNGFGTALSSFWLYDFGVNQTELYLQVGQAFGPNTANYPSDDNAVYISLLLTNYTGKPFEGPGTGNPVQETPFPTERTFGTHYFYEGYTWYLEFMEILNGERARLGRAPYQIMTRDLYTQYPRRTEKEHGDNVWETRVIEHESPSYPVGYQTVADRVALAGYRPGGYASENINFKLSTAFVGYSESYSDNVPVGSTLLLTPQEAYDAWYESAGHRFNMLRDWDEVEAGLQAKMTSVIGIAFAYYDTPQTINDDYNGFIYTNQIGWFSAITNVFVEIQETPVERLFSSNYNLFGAVIELLTVKYPLEAYVDVKADHTASYAIKVGNANVAPYGVRAAAQHIAPIFYSLSQSHQANYVGTVNVAKEFIASFDILVGDPVRAAHTSPFSGRTGQSNAAPYDALSNPRQSHTAPFSDFGGASQANIAPYGRFGEVRVEHQSPYEPLTTAQQDHSANYEPLVVAKQDNIASYSEFLIARQSHSANYEQFVVTRNDNAAVYQGLNTVRGSNKAVYQSAVKASASNSAIYAVNLAVAQAHIGNWINTIAVSQDYSADYGILNVEPVATDNRSFYTLLDGGIVNIQPNFDLTINNVTIKLSDAVISQDQGKPAWTCRARVADPAVFKSFGRLDNAQLTIGSEIFQLTVIDKNIARSFGQQDMVVTLESPITLKGAPYAPVNDFEFADTKLASEIFSEVIGYSPANINWEVADWSVPANTFKVGSSSPLAAATALLDATGAVLQALPNGDLQVRYKYPIALNRLYTATPDHTLNDLQDILGVSETYQYYSGINSVRVLQGESVFQDQLEFIANSDSPATGDLRVYLSPDRAVNIRTTDSTTPTSIGAGVLTSREETEVLEFINGSVSTRYPVQSIVNVDWKSDSLGAVTFEAGSKTLNSGVLVNQGYGLAEITYTTSSINYPVSGVEGDIEQFVLEEVS